MSASIAGGTAARRSHRSLILLVHVPKIAFATNKQELWDGGTNDEQFGNSINTFTLEVTDILLVILLSQKIITPKSSGARP